MAERKLSEDLAKYVWEYYDVWLSRDEWLALRDRAVVLEQRAEVAEARVRELETRIAEVKEA